MRRNTANAEPPFGSDSFLDVLANIVGILIILIVLVGLRVKNSPATPAPAADEPAMRELAAAKGRWEAEKRALDAANEQRRSRYEAAVRLRAAEVAERQAAQARRDQLQQRYAEQERSHAAEAARRQRLIDEYRRQAEWMQRDIAQLSQKLARPFDGTGVSDPTAAIAKHQARIAVLEEDIRAQEAALAELAARERRREDELAEIERSLASPRAERSPATQLIHDLTPISRQVDRTELHFRCLGQRVAYTHLDDLLELVRQQARSTPVTGPPTTPATVGPVGGFSLRYLIGRRDVSLSQQLRDPFASGYVLSAWELQSDSDTLGEGVDAALREDSKFRTIVARRAPAEFAVTLWVYPDSFELARVLRDWLHASGYVVAQRPLPAGVPIAGTPFGSASRGQ